MRYVLTALLISALSGCAFVKVNVGSELKGVEERVVSGKGRAKIVVIDISGIISMDHLGLERFGKEPPMIPQLQAQLNAASADGDVAGLVVRIDSPGGSVTASDIEQALAEQGMSIDRRKIQLGDAIKTLGTYEVVVALRKDVKAKLKVEVVAEQE